MSQRRSVWRVPWARRHAAQAAAARSILFQAWVCLRRSIRCVHASKNFVHNPLRLIRRASVPRRPMERYWSARLDSTTPASPPMPASCPDRPQCVPPRAEVGPAAPARMGAKRNAGIGYRLTLRSEILALRPLQVLGCVRRALVARLVAYAFAAAFGGGGAQRYVFHGGCMLRGGGAGIVAGGNDG
jgi:hypothetical protein